MTANANMNVARTSLRDGESPKRCVKGSPPISDPTNQITSTNRQNPQKPQIFTEDILCTLFCLRDRKRRSTHCKPCLGVGIKTRSQRRFEHINDASVFSTTKPSTVLVNTERSGLIDILAINKAPKLKRFAGACLDIQTWEEGMSFGDSTITLGWSRHRRSDRRQLRNLFNKSCG